MAAGLFALLALAVQQQAASIGCLPKEDLLSLLQQQGCFVSTTPTPGYDLLTRQSPPVILVFTYQKDRVSNQLQVATVVGHVEFDLAHIMPKEELAAWARREGLKADLHSYIDGKVLMDCDVASLTKDDIAALRTKLDRTFDYARRLEAVVSPFGARASVRPFELGSAALDPALRLTSIEAHDLDYLVKSFGWGHTFGAGSSNGWVTGGEPLGIPIMFSQPFYNQVGFRMTFAGSAKVERVEEPVDMSKGLTVAQIRDRILGFAKQIRSRRRT